MENHHKSASYRPCGCRADCCMGWKSTVAEPCWGEVEACDEFHSDDGDYFFFHACEGHWDQYDDEPYIPEPKGGEIGQAE